MFIVSGGVTFPIGDWSKRYQFGFPVGGDILFKLKNNLIFGVSAHYLFGESTREQELLSNIFPIFSGDGQLPAMDVGFRALIVRATFGGVVRIFPKANRNSGLLFLAGVGYGEHQTRIATTGGLIPQLGPDYLKGYDRYSNGLFLSQFLGYLHLSNSRRINFYAGIEWGQFLATPRRGWQYDIGPVPQVMGNDMTLGLRMGWIFPAYKRTKYRYIEFRD